MFDLQVPFFKPLWLRIGTVAFCIGWAIFEIAAGSVFWAILFGAAGLWSGYEFFIVWNPKDEDTGKDKK